MADELSEDWRRFSPSELMLLCDQLETSLAGADTARLLDAILHEALNRASTLPSLDHQAAEALRLLLVRQPPV